MEKLNQKDREHIIELLKMEFKELDHWLKLHLSDGGSFSIPFMEQFKKVETILNQLELTDKGSTPMTRCWDENHKVFGTIQDLQKRVEKLERNNTLSP